MSKNILRQHLKQKGIETRDFFIPVHQQPFFKKSGVISKKDRFPVAEAVSRKGFYLPSGNGLKVKDIFYIVQQIKKIQANK